MLKHCICFSSQHVIQISQAWLFWQLLTCLKRRQTIKMTFAAVYVWVCFCCWTPRHLFIIVHVMPDLFPAKQKMSWTKRVPHAIAWYFQKREVVTKIFGLWCSTELSVKTNCTEIKQTILPAKTIISGTFLPQIITNIYQSYANKLCPVFFS